MDPAGPAGARASLEFRSVAPGRPGSRRAPHAVAAASGRAPVAPAAEPASSWGTNVHSVIHNPSCLCGPGGSRSLGVTTWSVRSARKVPTATSRASHCSTSSCKIAVPVITRATTGAGFRCTSTLLPAAIRTASSQATPCLRATACAAARAKAVVGGHCHAASVRLHRSFGDRGAGRGKVAKTVVPHSSDSMRSSWVSLLERRSPSPKPPPFVNDGFAPRPSSATETKRWP